jgi:transposase
MRATRHLRRRLHVLRKRAERLAHIHHPHGQYNLPELGKKLASNANRAGVAERFPEPAAQQSLEVDLPLLGHYDQLRRAMALAILKTAQAPETNALYRLRTVPGSGEILSLVLLYDIHARERFPRAQEFGSSCRLVTWAKASAGKRYGTSGATMGNASLTWAFAEAAGRFWRAKPAGQKDRARLENKQSKGKALTGLAHT